MITHAHHTPARAHIRVVWRPHELHITLGACSVTGEVALSELARRNALR